MAAHAADDEDLVASIRAALRAAADPTRAPAQQAYMKSTMPFLGVSVPDTRRVARSMTSRSTAPETLLAAARTLWDEATHREERYAALALLAVRQLQGDPDLVPLIEHMVRTGRWWDFTDELAHRVAGLLDADPARMAAHVRSWSVDDEMWLRRLAIIAQLGRRERLDRALLGDAVLQNAEDPEFFLRKAIGWALRDAARSDPGWVLTFVATHDLSPLSVREATKHL